MKKHGKLLITAMAGALGAAMLCGAASAQDYNYGGDNDRVSESVIVHPYDRRFDRLQTQQLLGRHNGEINPVRLTLSRPVSYGDLDLTRIADVEELQGRIADTARDICLILDRRMPGLKDADADRQCVRDAVRQAMAQVPERAG